MHNFPKSPVLQATTGTSPVHNRGENLWTMTDNCGKHISPQIPKRNPQAIHTLSTRFPPTYTHQEVPPCHAPPQPSTPILSQSQSEPSGRTPTPATGPPTPASGRTSTAKPQYYAGEQRTSLSPDQPSPGRLWVTTNNFRGPRPDRAATGEGICGPWPPTRLAVCLPSGLRSAAVLCGRQIASRRRFPRPTTEQQF